MDHNMCKNGDCYNMLQLQRANQNVHSMLFFAIPTGEWTDFYFQNRLKYTWKTIILKTQIDHNIVATKMVAVVKNIFTSWH